LAPINSKKSYKERFGEAAGL